MTCVSRAQEGEPAEGLRRVPDLHRDDLAQRRIQGGLGPQRKPWNFVTLPSITEADLETWERLKVSGETRCVVFPLRFPLLVALFNLKGIECLSSHSFFILMAT